MSKDQPSFEDALKQLEEIVQKLEQGELALEKSLELYEKGIQLSRLCLGDKAVANELSEHECKGQLPFTARYLSTRIWHRLCAGPPRLDYT